MENPNFEQATGEVDEIAGDLSNFSMTKTNSKGTMEPMDGEGDDDGFGFDDGDDFGFGGEEEEPEAEPAPAAAAPKNENAVDYDADDYYDPNLPPRAPPAPKLGTPDPETKDRAITEDTILLTWQVQNQGLKSIRVQGRMIPESETSVNFTDPPFDPRVNPGDIQILTPSPNECTQVFVPGLLPNSMYVFRLVSVAKRGVTAGPVSEPFTTLEPERGLKSGFLKYAKHSGTKTQRRRLSFKKASKETVWVVLEEGKVTMSKTVDGTPTRVVLIKDISTIDSTESTRIDTKNFTITTEEKEDLEFTAADGDACKAWLSALRKEHGNAKAEFGSALNTGMIF